MDTKSINSESAHCRRAIPPAGLSEYVQWLLGRRRRFVVRERSMVPTLMPGDTVLAEPDRAVQVGDIAIFCWHIAGAKATTADTKQVSGLLIKRVSEVFADGGVYLISDNLHDPTVRDSRHFGVIATSRIIGRVTSRLASAL